MKTYQDLLAVGVSDSARGEFCASAIDEFMLSEDYQNAKDGQAYYDKHNITIEKFKKFLYTLSGKKIEDIWSANYKLKTLFFRRLVMQITQYVLGNGLKLDNTANKEKLGKDFDYQLQKACKIAMAQGKAFGFWNYNHMEVFGYADTKKMPGYCPLKSEEDAEMYAGIRFWFRRVGEHVITRMTLYEIDGITEYRRTDNEPVELMTPKKPYKVVKTVTENGIVVREDAEVYDGFPIVMLYASDTEESELIGIREEIDCYDFIKSGLANVIDDNADVYWLIQNAGGMDDKDLAQFLARLKKTHAAAVDEEGAKAEAHTLDVPYEARQTMLEILKKDIYDDFQALNVETLSAAAKTTQEIQAAYQSQDNKSADLEYLLIDFVQKILALAGIDDNPTFTWNRVVNQAEQTNMIIMSANYLTDEAVIKHLPYLTPEEADQIIEERKKMELSSFGMGKNAQEGEEEIEGDEIDTEEEKDENGANSEV